MAKASIDQNQKPTTPSASPMYITGAQVFGLDSKTCKCIRRKLGWNWNSKILNQHLDVGCQHCKQWLNLLCQNPMSDRIFWCKIYFINFSVSFFICCQYVLSVVSKFKAKRYLCFLLRILYYLFKWKFFEDIFVYVVW